MLPHLTPASRRRHFAGAALISSVALAVVLTGCGGKDDAHASGSGQVASVQKGDKGVGDASAAANKKYKAGSPELKKAQDNYLPQFNTCLTRKAQAAGIATEMGVGKDEGSVTAKDLGPVVFKAGGVIEGSPLAKKWFAQVYDPCKKEVPWPDADDAGDKDATLATAKKQYQCLNKASLSDLHEPTNDAPQLFTEDGTRKYFGGNLDPRSKQILQKCGIPQD
ncbi:hypothetical protein [Streptomyces sp. NPDC050485]|uniref:hypothetical protein n=1 Tax=Streptomyces sp. NPDC050485 TaxID=3365617 RepID=UPI0037982F79